MQTTCLNLQAHERGVWPAGLLTNTRLEGDLTLAHRQVNCDILIGLLSRAVHQRRKAFQEAKKMHYLQRVTKSMQAKNLNVCIYIIERTMFPSFLICLKILPFFGIDNL